MPPDESDEPTPREPLVLEVDEETTLPPTSVEVDLDEPRSNEVLVKVAAAGLCHSDDHLASGDIPVPVLPYAGGHEGAGTVVDVGPGTRLGCGSPPLDEPIVTLEYEPPEDVAAPRSKRRRARAAATVSSGP